MINVSGLCLCLGDTVLYIDGPHRPGSERRSRSTTGFTGREFGTGWADDVLPLPPAWTYEARLS